MPPVLAHYMPWFVYDDDSGKAGWHWHMGRHDLVQSIAKGTKRVAAHKVPLIGPYDSQDRHVIRYHLALMRQAGIQGVIIDWYGTRNSPSLPKQEVTEAIVDECVNAGMVFTVCYEDWVLIPNVTWGRRPEGDRLAAARSQLVSDFAYLRDRLVSRPGFLRDPHSGRPLALVFGPRILTEKEDWEAMEEAVWPNRTEAPMVLSLGGKALTEGRFSWFPKMSNRTSLDDVYSYLTGFYGGGYKRNVTMGSLFPGFHDYYSEGSNGRLRSYGHIPEYDDLTEEVAFKEAKVHKPDFLQLITWNDWQEGTTFEPSEEDRFDRLLQLQKQLRNFADEATFNDTLTAYLECKFTNEPANWYYWEPACRPGMSGCKADGEALPCRFCGPPHYLDVPCFPTLGGGSTT